MSMDERLERIERRISPFDDFPKAGIRFRNIFPVFEEPDILIDVVDILKEYIEKYSPNATAIAGVEAKGFLFSTILARDMKLKFVPVRKKGKLPGQIEEITYFNSITDKEDAFIISKNVLQPDDRVIIVDDILMSGDMISATSQLIKNVGAKVDGAFTVIELVDLRGRERIERYTHLHTLIEFNK